MKEVAYIREKTQYFLGDSHADFVKKIQEHAAETGRPKYVVLSDYTEVLFYPDEVRVVGRADRARRRQLARAGFRIADASWRDVQQVLA